MRAVVRIAAGLRLPRIRKDRPGSAAGLDRDQLGAMRSTSGVVKVTVINYCPDRVLSQEIDDIKQFVAGQHVVRACGRAYETISA